MIQIYNINRVTDLGFSLQLGIYIGPFFFLHLLELGVLRAFRSTCFFCLYGRIFTSNQGGGSVSSETFSTHKGGEKCVEQFEVVKSERPLPRPGYCLKDGVKGDV